MIPGPRFDSYSLGGSRIDRFRRLGEVSLTIFPHIEMCMFLRGSVGVCSGVFQYLSLLFSLCWLLLVLLFILCIEGNIEWKCNIGVFHALLCWEALSQSWDLDVPGEKGPPLSGHIKSEKPHPIGSPLLGEPLGNMFFSGSFSKCKLSIFVVFV
jgi:hypothetical protein